MDWVPLEPWPVGGTPDADFMNEQISEHLRFLYSPPGCFATHNANQAITTATATALSMNTTRFDNDAMHDDVTLNTQIVIVTAGCYDLAGCVAMEGNATGVRIAAIRLNGLTDLVAIEHPVVSAVPLILNPNMGRVPLQAGDYLELTMYHTRGSNLNSLATPYAPVLMVEWAAGLEEAA